MKTLEQLEKLADSQLGHLSWDFVPIQNLHDYFIVASADSLSHFPQEASMAETLNEMNLPDNFIHFGEARKQEYLLSRLLIRYLSFSKFPERSIFEIERFYKRNMGDLAGSMTHSRGLVRVGLAGREHYQYLGIDSELEERAGLNKDRLWNKITSEKEQQRLRQIGCTQMRFRALVFSAKEALYKYAYPFYQKYFGFHDAEVLEVTEHYVSLTSPVLKLNGQEEVRAYYQFCDGYVHTLIMG